MISSITQGFDMDNDAAANLFQRQPHGHLETHFGSLPILQGSHQHVCGGVKEEVVEDDLKRLWNHRAARLGRKLLPHR